MPACAKNLRPWSVVSRPLEGEAPAIDLAVGYSKANSSPVLMSRLDELVGPNASGDPANSGGLRAIRNSRLAGIHDQLRAGRV